MKKILLLADTHMPKKRKDFPVDLLHVLKEGVDLIIHAGDWSEKSVYKELIHYAPVYGVQGNIEKDGWTKQLPFKKVIQVENKKIAIVHGHLGKGRTTPDRAFQSCMDEEPDLIVFGHSHIPFMEQRDKVMLFNPGSPTDKRKQKQFSFGLLTIDTNGMELKHHYFT
ncbi:metallophosphoesterase family protein [Fictibacillus phosphorivorans]|uniref:metallophosphoesterase family protein n=1 Tax=Fictibacillus phosphorivorans TaxID=1221500 RepID=UPI00203FBB9D|nr:metallophosphoesterase family protein [Fictibacillus phosphorivorans]MCM3719600.1 metallophosphatase family protein [Fictibacillus phosphorivorans]MCM3777326.1 metallophosphatase family protein [Fictibacillus phosphorivorans]